MVKKLNPKIDEVSRRKQGSTDPETAWAGARLNWVTQLLIRFGKIKLSSDNTPEYLHDLPLLSIQQITFWDEVHKEQIVSCRGNKSYHFPCNANGRYDANDTIQSKAGSGLHMKYPEQA